jgi:MPBQ/MSBQ methyltransferase
VDSPHVAVGRGGLAPGKWLSGAGATPFTARLNDRYDRLMFEGLVDGYYGQSGFHNFGYWSPSTRTQCEASRDLVERLLQFLPRKSGSILDVACGLGATTKQLLRHYKPWCVTAVNISDKQLAACRLRAPGCTFLCMDAANLEFPVDSFDNIICVEAAFHFNTRRQFLGEALRVLKPGGYLAVSDILLRAAETQAPRSFVPQDNHVHDLGHYQRLYRDAGFDRVDVVDATHECWLQFHQHAVRYAVDQFVLGKIPPEVVRKIRVSLHLWGLAIRHYVLAGARKPASERRAREPKRAGARRP